MDDLDSVTCRVPLATLECQTQHSQLPNAPQAANKECQWLFHCFTCMQVLTQQGEQSPQPWNQNPIMCPPYTRSWALGTHPASWPFATHAHQGGTPRTKGPSVGLGVNTVIPALLHCFPRFPPIKLINCVRLRCWCWRWECMGGFTQTP